MPTIPANPDAADFLAALAQEHRSQASLAARSAAVRARPGLEQIRQAIADQLRGSQGISAAYRGGEVNRMNAWWQPASSSADGRNSNPSLLLARARDLADNDPLAGAAIQRFVENTAPIEVDAAVESDDPDGLNDPFNSESDRLWREWKEQADYSGEETFDELQQAAIRTVAASGEAILLECALPIGGLRRVPLCYQLLDADAIDESFDRDQSANQNAIRRGIEFDRAGRRVAYYLLTEQTGYDSRGARYPAARVQHLFRRLWRGQTRGVTWLAPVMMFLKNLNWYLDNELTAAGICSLFAAVIESDSAANGGGIGLQSPDGQTQDVNGNYLTALGAGIVATLRKGETIKTVDPQRPAANAAPWIDLMTGLIANGLGMSRLALTKDWSKTNYSGGKGNQLDDRRLWRRLQAWFGKTPLAVRRRWTTQMFAFDQFTTASSRDYFRDPAHWLAGEILPPGWEWLDMAKEVDADLRAIAGNLLSYKEVFARTGRDYRRIWRQSHRERQLATTLGFEFPTNLPNGPAPQGPARSTDDQAPSNDPENSPEEE